MSSPVPRLCYIIRPLMSSPLVPIGRLAWRRLQRAPHTKAALPVTARVQECCTENRKLYESFSEATGPEAAERLSRARSFQMGENGISEVCASVCESSGEQTLNGLSETKKRKSPTPIS